MTYLTKDMLRRPYVTKALSHKTITALTLSLTSQNHQPGTEVFSELVLSHNFAR